jgi:hypothetical protein
MTDLNGNNLIEKDVKIETGGCSSLDEGYNEKADIDGDGKITISEAKFYLHGLRSVDVEEQNKFPLTETDTKILYEAFKNSSDYKFSEEFTKAKSLSGFAKKLLEKGGKEEVVIRIFKEALGIAEKAKQQNEEQGIKTLKSIINDMFWGGFVTDALEEAQRLGIEFKPNPLWLK